MYELSITQVEQVVIDISREVTKIKFKEKSWKIITEQELWNELVGCIMSSKVIYEHAISAFNHLLISGYLDISFVTQNPSIVKGKIYDELKRSIFLPQKKNGSFRKFRYPKKIADFICASAGNIYTKNLSLKFLLNSVKREDQARLLLMNLVKGMGPKQVSMFLRNVSYTHHLAIIDNHVLNFLKQMGLLNQNHPSPKNMEQYHAIENVFISYANKHRIIPSDLDMAIWTVMRMVNVRNA